MDINIKNMVCNRCIMAVSQIFNEAGINVESVQLGKVKTTEEVDPDKLDYLNSRLESVGFEIIHDSKRRIIEKIKTATIDFVYHPSAKNKMNFSEYLIDKLHLDYPYLSTLYSSVEGTTIEKHLINLKIERVKELLVYDKKT